MKELRVAAEILERLSHNQDALRAAVEELAKWVGDRGATSVVGNVNGALATMDDNIDAVRNGIAELVAPAGKSDSSMSTHDADQLVLSHLGKW